MPINLTFGCAGCGHSWKESGFTREDADRLKKQAPPCPACGGGAQQELSAPSVNRGDAKPGITVPQSQAARETLAADLALKGTGMTDINSHMKVGDIAAKPIPLTSLPKDIPHQHRAALETQLRPSFSGAEHAGYGMALADPNKRRNLGLFGAGNKLPPVNRVPGTTIHRPTRKS